ncbi:transmembrane amino acid transporter protein-domain-containing protein [Hyaloraphidium curvatum]|nr:transmembrane amino acid transporter protein-domain-containing protein [Hyaloraphidium curvatum]
MPKPTFSSAGAASPSTPRSPFEIGFRPAHALDTPRGSPEGSPIKPHAAVPSRTLSPPSDEESVGSEATPPSSPHLSSFGHTVANTSNMLVGIGILALPRAIAQVGWIPGATTLLAVCFATVRTAGMLAACMDAEAGDGTRIMTYADVGRAAFGRWGEVAVGCVVALDLLVVSVTYLIVCADSVASLLPSAAGSLWLYVVIGVVVAPLTFVGSMRYLSYVAAFGLLSIIFLLVTLFTLGFLPAQSPLPDPTGSILRPSPTHLVSHTFPSALPLTYGIAMASLAGHIVLPSLKREMRDESRFGAAVALSYALVAATYLAFGAAGYLMFGDHSEAEVTGNIARMAGQGRYPRWVAAAIAGVWAANPVSKVGVVMEVVGRMAEGAVARMVEGWKGEKEAAGQGVERPRAPSPAAIADRWSPRLPAFFGRPMDTPSAEMPESQAVPEVAIEQDNGSISSDSEDEPFARRSPLASFHTPSSAIRQSNFPTPANSSERTPLLRPPSPFPIPIPIAPPQPATLPRPFRIPLRIALLLVVLLLSYLLPSFLRAAALLGSALATPTALVFPCACYLRMFPHAGRMDRAFGWAMLLAGVGMGTWGVWAAAMAG